MIFKATAAMVLMLVVFAAGSAFSGAAAQDCTYNQASGDECATPEAGPSVTATTAPTPTPGSTSTPSPTADADPTTEEFPDEAERGSREREIAFTGDDSATLSYVAAGLIGGGIILLALARKKQRDEG